MEYLLLQCHWLWLGCGSCRLKFALGSSSLAFFSREVSFPWKAGRGRQAGGWELRPPWHGAGMCLGCSLRPENQEVHLGPAVQTWPLRAGWNSTLPLSERLFRYVCPAARRYDGSSFKVTPTHFWQSSAGLIPTNAGDDEVLVPVTQGSAAYDLSRGSGRFTQLVPQTVLPHA